MNSLVSTQPIEELPPVTPLRKKATASRAAGNALIPDKGEYTQ